MKTLLIARKNLVEISRDPALLALTLLTPFFFLLICWVGYGTAPKLATYTILILDDGGTAQAQQLIAHLETSRYADGRPLFDLRLIADRETAEAELKAQTAALLVILSPAAADPVGITIRGDGTSMRFITASTLLEQRLAPALDALRGIARPQVWVEEPVMAAAPASEFDAYTPGMMVFAVLMIIPQTTLMVAREIRSGALRRLQLSRLSSWELLGGITLAQMVMAAGQILVMFLTALALGFHNQGSLILAVMIGLLLSLSATGFGLLVACFVSNDNDAVNLGGTVAMLQVFLSGSFFAMPAITLFRLGGYEINLFDFIPASHGMLALQQVLSGGAGLGEVGFRIVMMIALSVLYFTVSVIIFGRMHRR